MTRRLSIDKLSHLGFDVKHITFESSVCIGLFENTEYAYIGCRKSDNMVRIIALSSQGYHYFSLPFPIFVNSAVGHLGPGRTFDDIVPIIFNDSPKFKKRDSLSMSIQKFSNIIS